jgi:hypothetical protein
MGLFRRGMKRPRSPEVTPELLGQLAEIIHVNTSGREAANTRALYMLERSITLRLEKIMHTLQDLLGAVTAQRSQIDSLVALTRGLHRQVVEALGDTATPSMQMRIDQVFDAVSANADAVADAIKENTVDATAGAISEGQSLSDIKNSGNSLNPGLDAGQLQQEQGKVDREQGKVNDPASGS